MELSSSLNSVLGDLIIRFPNAESHSLVQALREEARSTGRKLDEVVHVYIIRSINTYFVFGSQEREITEVDRGKVQERLPYT